jgi:hypothetical protein
MLYIKVQNGQPIDHPVFPDNLMEVFGEIPAEYETFNRMPSPVPGQFEVLEHPPVYAKVDVAWTDVWTVRPMTAEEKAQFTQEILFKVTSQIADMREHFGNQITENSTDSDREIVAKYIADLDAVDVSDPFNAKIPPAPFKGADGHFTTPSTNVNASGGAPNVIS